MEQVDGERKQLNILPGDVITVLNDAVDWMTKKGGDASEEPETVWLVLGIFNNGVSRECLVNCYRQLASFERATARGL